MYQAGLFKTIDEQKIAEEVRKQGFDPIYITDLPGRTYPPHHHPETKVLVFLAGSMEVVVQEQNFDCRPGDWLIIPGNIEHSAIAGSRGCGFLWSEKL